jgi:hypothetical protein
VELNEADVFLSVTSRNLHGSIEAVTDYWLFVILTPFNRAVIVIGHPLGGTTDMTIGIACGYGYRVNLVPASVIPEVLLDFLFCSRVG